MDLGNRIRKSELETLQGEPFQLFDGWNNCIYRGYNTSYPSIVIIKGSRWLVSLDLFSSWFLWISPWDSSPLNHHLAEYFLLFPSTLSKPKIRNSRLPPPWKSQNISPEKGPFQKESILPSTIFQGSVFQGVGGFTFFWWSFCLFNNLKISMSVEMMLKPSTRTESCQRVTPLFFQRNCQGFGVVWLNDLFLRAIGKTTKSDTNDEILQIFQEKVHGNEMQEVANSKLPRKMDFDCKKTSPKRHQKPGFPMFSWFQDPPSRPITETSAWKSRSPCPWFWKGKSPVPWCVRAQGVLSPSTTVSWGRDVALGEKRPGKKTTLLRRQWGQILCVLTESLRIFSRGFKG